MKNLILATLLALSSCVHAAAQTYVAVFPNVTIVLTQAPCTSKVIQAHIASMPAASSMAFLAGSAVYKGKPIELCWTVLDAEHIGIVDDSGDTGTAPMAAFRPSDNI